MPSGSRATFASSPLRERVVNGQTAGCRFATGPGGSSVTCNSLAFTETWGTYPPGHAPEQRNGPAAHLKYTLTSLVSPLLSSSRVSALPTGHDGPEKSGF